MYFRADGVRFPGTAPLTLLGPVHSLPRLVLGYVDHRLLPQQSMLLTRYHHNDGNQKKGSATRRQEDSSECRQVSGKEIGSEKDRLHEEGQICLQLGSRKR